MKRTALFGLRTGLSTLLILAAATSHFILVNPASAQIRERSNEIDVTAGRSDRSPASSDSAGVPTLVQYQIFDIGVVQMGDTASQGFGVSTGSTAVGRSIRTGGAQAFSWTLGGGIVGLPNLAGRAFCVSNGAK